VKCDKCQASEATVHEVMIKGGKRHEKHLCEQCAKSEGVAPVVVSQTPITQLLSPYVTVMQGEVSGGGGTAVPGAGGGAGTMVSACACCGITYASFRQTGLLGCAECYTSFEQQLVPMIARAHEGGTRHVGKSPRRPLPGVPEDRSELKALERAAALEAEKAARREAEARLLAERALMLQKRLNEAVAAEQYEKAAQLRDELAKLSGGMNPQKRTRKAAAPKPPAPKPADGDNAGGKA
jgi:protein arginine kinase activator